MGSPQGKAERMLSLEELATEAEVDPAFVSRMIELGALEPKGGVQPFTLI